MALARVLGAIGRLMIRGGVLILLLVAFQLWGTGIHTSEVQHDLRKEFDAAKAQVSATTSTTQPVTDATGQTQPTVAPPQTAAPIGTIPKPGQALGEINIPRIGSDFIFVEGVDLKYLSEGPGHFPTTPLPGQAGNAAIAGHRTTYKAPFNRLDEVRPGDDIFITTTQGKFTYQVLPQQDADGPPVGHRIVKPNAVEILADKGDNRLTLMACNPKYYATQRIVVEAKLVGNPAATTPRPKGSARQDLAGLTKGDEGARRPAILWGLAALAIWFLTWWASQRLKPQGLVRWTPYVAGLPVFLVLLYASFEAFSKVLPGAF